MCGPSWSTSPSPPPRPGSPPLGDRRSGAKTPWKTPSTLRSASRAIPSPSRSRSTNTINGCPGRAARRGVVGPVVAARAKSAPVPPSSYRKNRLRHLPTGRFRRSDHSPLVRTGLNRALTASPKEVILRLKRLDFLSLAAESILYSTTDFAHGYLKFRISSDLQNKASPFQSVQNRFPFTPMTIFSFSI